MTQASATNRPFVRVPCPAAVHARSEARCAYWRRTQGLTLGLLVLWGAATFLPVWLAPALEGVRFFGWPLSYFLTAQASLLVFVLIVWLYARLMDQLDRECLNSAAHHNKPDA